MSHVYRTPSPPPPPAGGQPPTPAGSPARRLARLLCRCGGAGGKPCGCGNVKALLLLVAALLLALFLLRRCLALALYAYLAGLVLLGLIGLARVLRGVLTKVCWKALGDPKGEGSAGHPPSRGVRVPPHTYKRPDPMIYSQQYLKAKGLAVTWDNPDIQLYAGDAAVSSHELAPKTTYRVRARIWNGSVDAPAVGVLVKFYYLSFGIGAARHYIGQALVDVPVKGSPSSPTHAEVAWQTPETPGHYCLQAEIVWSDDANPANNLGQENVDVKQLNSPNATFRFVVRNPAPERRTLRLVADGYTLPPLPPCGPARPAGTRGDRGGGERDPAAAHRPDAWQIPAGWKVELDRGEALTLDAGEQREVTVRITATDGHVEKQAININAYDAAGLVGGVTLYVHS